MESRIHKQRSQRLPSPPPTFFSFLSLADEKMAASRVRIMLVVLMSDLVVPFHGVTCIVFLRYICSDACNDVVSSSDYITP